MNELELILTDVRRCCRADLYLNSFAVLKEREFARLDRILKRRSKDVPLQYILGYAEFMGLRFKVHRGVLIPRPETEILVETVIDKTQNSKLKTKNLELKILDVGTGSGCIAVSLAKLLKNVNIVAIDIPRQAIDLAKENARAHNVESRIDFLEKDIFNYSDKFDIIVTNPPYVATSEIGMFDKTTANEPRIALDGGSDGLDFYRRISKSIASLLNKNGLLIMEIGFGQAREVEKIFSGWKIEELIKDYQGIERVLVIRRENHG
jgi:release factor glutamine methyltransferase